MKKITETQLRKLIESKVKRMLKENSLEKQQQMDSDWADYEDANDKYQGEKFSPTLAKHYNHNVEDGREEAEAHASGMVESAIKKMVKNILKEDYCWYGDTEPLETIIQACKQIMESSKFNDPEYEGDDDDAAAYHVYKWAEKVAQDAEEYLHCNSRNTSINGGENW